MKTKIDSRGPQIDTDLCVEMTQGMGRFAMVIAAAQRAREIRRRNKESDRFEHLHPIVTSLLELQEGKLDVQEYFRKVK